MDKSSYRNSTLFFSRYHIWYQTIVLTGVFLLLVCACYFCFVSFLFCVGLLFSLTIARILLLLPLVVWVVTWPNGIESQFGVSFSLDKHYNMYYLRYKYNLSNIPLCRLTSTSMICEYVYKSAPIVCAYAHTHAHIYIYIYIYGINDTISNTVLLEPIEIIFFLLPIYLHRHHWVTYCGIFLSCTCEMCHVP